MTWNTLNRKAMILVKYDFPEISIIFNCPLSKVNFVAIVCIILTESPTRVIAWNVSRETCVPLIWNAGIEEEQDDFGSTPDFKLIKHEPFGRTWERIYLLFRFASIWRNRWLFSFVISFSVCAGRIFRLSFRSNGREIDLTTGNRIYKSFEPGRNSFVECNV